MKLADLKAAGGFVPSAPVACSVEWKRDNETLAFVIHVKRHSFGTIEQLLSDKDDEKSRSAAYIAESILLGDNGKEKLSYADAYALEPSLAAVFIKAINDVNGTGDSSKNSNPPT